MPQQISRILTLSLCLSLLVVAREASAQNNSPPVLLFERGATIANQDFGAAVACVDNFAAPGTYSVGIGFPGPVTDSGFIVVDGATGTTVQASGTNPGQDARFGAAMAPGFVQFATGGFTELLVGFPSFSPSITPSGVSVIAGPNGANSFTPFNSFGFSDAVGVSVRSLLDDSDNDGLNDFVYGAPSAGMIGAVFLDDVNQSGGPIATYFGETADEAFGTAVDSIQDQDGQGVRDIIVGAPFFAGVPGPGTGAVRIISTESGTELFAAEGDAGSDTFGYAVANLGDIDGDGVEDFAVGAPAFDDLPRPGYVRVFKGAVGSPPTVLCTINSTEPQNEFGVALARLGDIDGDTFTEFAIGAPGEGGGTGAVAIARYDSASGACSVPYQINGTISGERFGAALSGAPRPNNICDLNGDNIADFVVGAPNADQPGAANGGRVLFYRGVFPPPPTPTATPTATPLPVPPLRPAVQFKLRRDGQLDGSVSLNRLPLEPCQISLFARTSRADRTEVGPLLRLGRLGNVVDDRVRFSANALRRAVCDARGDSYSVHLLARVQCEAKEFFSPVRARQMVCGREPPLGRAAWETQLVDRFRYVTGAKKLTRKRRARK